VDVSLGIILVIGKDLSRRRAFGVWDQFLRASGNDIQNEN